MTTPAERITAYLDARRRFPINTDQLAECKIGAQDWTYLTETDLRAVLADNERLTAELAETRAKLAAASRALAATAPTRAREGRGGDSGAETHSDSETGGGKDLAQGTVTGMRPFSELRSAGIIWAINRALFHPRGYALGIHYDDDNNALGWSILGDGTEPWVYEASVDEDERFASFERTLREAAEAEIPGDHETESGESSP